MKSVWFFFLLASLFSIRYCSIKGNTVNQPSSLLKSAFRTLAKWQIGHSLSKEPFVAYNKLKDGTLEIFGTAFGNEVTKEKILFLQKVTSSFRIHSVVLKWFYFDEKMQRIFDVFHEKLQNSVKSITFEKCYFPERLIFKSSPELNNVADCSFIQCFANEDSFKEMFKMFRNAPVNSLTISKVFDCKQDESIDTNVALKSIDASIAKEKLMKITNLKLDSFFPNISFLSLSPSSLDFDHFNLTSLKNLNSVDLSSDIYKNLRVRKILECLPTNVKCIKLPNSSTVEDLNFIGTAFDQNVIIDFLLPYDYNQINRVKALSVLSSLHLFMICVNDKMAIIKEYVERNGGAVNTVTSVRFDMTFNYQNIKNMITLLTYFPNLNNIELHFSGNCDVSLNDNEIQLLFSNVPVMDVKKLTIFYAQKVETTAFYRFIVELMKLCQKMSTLEFHYFSSNSFAITIKEMVEKENIKFANLDTFKTDYWSDGIDVSIDLFYVAKYNIKNLTVDINCLNFDPVQYLDGLDQFECFFVDTLEFKAYSISNSERFINKFFAKFPRVTNFSWDSDLCYLIPNGVLQNMRGLKQVIVKGIFFRKNILNFLSLLPHDLESLRIECYFGTIEEFEKVFYEKFPSATLSMAAM